MGRIYWRFKQIQKISGKFPKILIFLDLPECKFRLAWWYDEMSSSHTSSTWLGLKKEEKWV
jgi:hypothetical protein